MSETRKILVALDGSKHSEYALNCEYFYTCVVCLRVKVGVNVVSTHSIHLHLHEINLSSFTVTIG